ncbi:MAG: TRAP transporter small permease subunit [Bacteroidota bacterium]
MEKFIALVNVLNEKVGQFFSWSAVALVILISSEVLMRYAFNTSIIWLAELETYFFVFIFLIAAGYAFKHNKHVRVDLFYDTFSEKRKAWVNLIGGVFFLLPWSGIVVWYTFQFAYRSFEIGEKSAQPGGLPMLWILKFGVFLGFAFLFLQGIASVLNAIQTIRKK